MRTLKSFESLEGRKWFVPVAPGLGSPIFQLPVDPLGRKLMCAFTTQEKCEAAIARWFPGTQVKVVDDPSAMNDDAVSRGYTVAVDLCDDGQAWKFSEFVRSTFSPGGDC